MGRGRELMDLYLDIFNRRAFDRLEEVISPAYEINVPGHGNGIEWTRKAVTGLCTMVPDIQGSLEWAVEEGSEVVGLFRWKGTHTQVFLGMEPTGVALEWTTADFWRFTDKLVYHREVVDGLAVVEAVRKSQGHPPLVLRPPPPPKA